MTRVLQGVAWMFVLLAVCAVPDEATAGSSSRTSHVVRMTLLNGASYTTTLEGVGCSATLCSRIAVTTTATGGSHLNRIPLDTVAGVTDVTSDGALFVFKDGTKRRLSVVHDNQVLYLSNAGGGAAKINLAGVQSIEFLGSER